MKKGLSYSKGFTLIEILIVIAVFLLIGTAVIGTYVKIFQLIEINKLKVTALDLANEQIEIIRNLPYADVGEVSGIPSGKIISSQTLTRSGIPFNVNTTIRNVDDPFDGQIGSSTNNDLSPADYKMVQVDISPQNGMFAQPMSLITHVAPKNLEGASTNGALFVKVFDANGISIQGADVHIQNTSVSPNVSIDDVTNAQGMLNLVDVPPGSDYSITVSKSGYSTEQTYPNGGAGNPNPTKPDGTVIIQQVTQVSFSIDQLSSMTFQSVDAQCQLVSNIGFTLQGSKLIGTPSVYKYSGTLNTGESGSITQSDFEWDSYSLALTGSTYDLIGSNPILPLNLLPNSTQDVQLVVAPSDPNTLLVSVIDNATGLPLTDASVTLSSGGYDNTLTTGRGFTKQTDWSGGSGQANFGSLNRYFTDDGNINADGNPGELTLDDIFGSYQSSGYLISSIFDLATTTNFSQITWKPNDQPPATGAGNVRMQIATSEVNTATTTWDYIGPDGTGGSYFTTSDQNISGSNAGRYIRYKTFLATASSTATPNISDVLITYTSSCVPPGQAVFTGLSSDTYTLTVSKSGYQDYSASQSVISAYQTRNIILSQ